MAEVNQAILEKPVKLIASPRQSAFGLNVRRLTTPIKATNDIELCGPHEQPG
jgi:hypothetical protein